MRKPKRPDVGALWDRVVTPWRDRPGESGTPAVEQDRRLERRLEAVETRVEHLEAALEGLQDAVYRQAQRGDADIEELRRRTEPERIARELSDDARRRGL
jgi:uncharacterized coiled-coil protein SlyX